MDPELTPEERARIERATARYMAAAHAMQSAEGYVYGVKLRNALCSRHQEQEPANDLTLRLVDEFVRLAKHLRVGINSAHVTNKAHVDLLMRKGIFTLVEYHEQLAEAMEVEAEAARQRAIAECGLPPTTTFA